METFVVYANWQASAPFGEDTLAEISRQFRPDDEDTCIWIDERNDSILRICIDIEAADEAELNHLAEAAITEAARTVALPGHIGDLTAFRSDDD
ncbi:MAG: hypothetical protein JWO79_4434 [Actinomycetia bacterium]|nr:hypothetical protein [Actinomycetes bacterium]